MKQMIFLVWIVAAASVPKLTEASSSSSYGFPTAILGFEYNNVATCESNVLQMDSVSFDCSGGGGGNGNDDGNDDDGGNDDGSSSSSSSSSSTGCTTGTNVSMAGQFTITLPIPDEVNLKVQVCKFWGNLCTPYLIERDINLCDQLGIDASNVETDDAFNSDYYCAPAGQYYFQTQFSLPGTSLADNFAIPGLTFRIYLLMNNEITCHAEFTTTRTSTTSSSTSSSSQQQSQQSQQQSQPQQKQSQPSSSYYQPYTTYSSSTSTASDSHYSSVAITLGVSVLVIAAALFSGFAIHEAGNRKQQRIARLDLRQEEEEEEDEEIERQLSHHRSSSQHHHRSRSRSPQRSSRSLRLSRSRSQSRGRHYKQHSMDLDDDHYVTL